MAGPIESNNSKPWGWKWIAIAALAIGIPSTYLAGLQTYDWYTSGPNLQVAGTSYKIELPRSLTVDIHTENLGASDSEFRTFLTYVSFTVSNTGRKTAEAVEVEFDCDGIYSLQAKTDADKIPLEQSFMDIIHLGEIKSGRSITVTAWTNSVRPVESIVMTVDGNDSEAFYFPAHESKLVYLATLVGFMVILGILFGVISTRLGRLSSLVNASVNEQKVQGAGNSPRPAKPDAGIISDPSDSPHD